MYTSVSISISIYQSHLVFHSSIDGHLSCFLFLAIVNNDVVKISIQLVFSSFVQMPRREIAG